MSGTGYKHPAWDEIEPIAKVQSQTPTTVRPGEHEIQLSIAISLKRIADALAPADGDSVNHLLHQIALNGIPRA